MITLNDQPLTDACSIIDAIGFAEWTPLRIACPPLPNAISATLIIGDEALGEPKTTPFDALWRWNWQPRGVAGVVEIRLNVEFADAPTLDQAWRIVLRPRLLDLQTWEGLLDDLAQTARQSAIACGGSAFAHALLVPAQLGQRSYLEDALLLLQRHSRDLEQVTRRIQAHPATILRLQSQRLPTPEAQHFDATTLAEPPQELIPLELPASEALQHVPATVRVQRSTASTDIPEHRWLAGLLAEVQRRGRLLRHIAEEELVRSRVSPLPAQAGFAGEGNLWHERLTNLCHDLERMLQRLNRLRSESPLTGVAPQAAPPASQRLNRDRRYRPLRRIWQELRAVPLLTLELPELGLPLADLPTLYERWCLVRVFKALMELQPTATNLLIKDAERQRWTFGFQTGKPLIEGSLGAGKWRLRYQPRYTSRPDRLGLVSLDGYTRIPDIVIELLFEHKPAQLVVFDAKYRRANDHRVPQDALDDVYAYAASLGRDQHSAVVRAAVLYPHTGPVEEYGTIAAIPLQPGHTTTFDDYLVTLMTTQMEP